MASEEIAKLLLDIKAVALNTEEPFRYTSGILSPIYCDNRLVISYPDKREVVIQAFLDLIREQNLEFDVVGGTATAGIPHAAWIADRLKKPMIYIRGKEKGHGKKNRIEGVIKKGQTVLIVEDLISTGGSSVDAGLAVREEGGVVIDCIAIFTYEMQKARAAFSEADIQLHTLTNFSTLVDVASANGYIKKDEQEKILAWNKDPQAWGSAMGYE
ncbi:MAG: orotate phosphoribosyltransferase [Candidatus Kerfeldbacteria bacterium]